MLLQVEKLIKELPTAPSDSSNVEPGTGVRETQSILLERIASEMNRLKFYISHAQVCVSIYSCAVETGTQNYISVAFITEKNATKKKLFDKKKRNMAISQHVLVLP